MRIAHINLIKHPLYLISSKLHFSFIIQDNAIIEWGCNMWHTPPIHMGYKKRINGGAPKFHSEIVAYKKARGILTKSHFEMINIRLNKQYNTLLSKPCVVCYDILSKLGCMCFYYTIEGNKYART